MSADRYYDQKIETMERGDLDVLIDERVHYTVQYAAEHPRFNGTGSVKTG
jgi:phenylacetate-coenzyme A ligase PaaK-like adenylate-forming protein